LKGLQGQAPGRTIKVQNGKCKIEEVIRRRRIPQL